VIAAPPRRHSRASGNPLQNPPQILFQAQNLIIIDKPAGLPVHPGRAGGPSIEDFFPLWRHGKTGPWLAHRLDQDTAGCLVIALKKSTLIAAQALFMSGTVEKTYWAVVRGVPAATSGVIDAPLAKHTAGRTWKMVPDQTALPCLTHWRLLGQGQNIAWLEFSPATGRTHQIRAHAAAIGHPILGDEVYGGGAGVLHLLAQRIKIPLTPPAAAEAPVPPHMRAALQSCGHAAS
jgi:tRNA pseudouridine32 synthase/23S rRNA pseudouridine746 synthase